MSLHDEQTDVIEEEKMTDNNTLLTRANQAGCACDPGTTDKVEIKDKERAQVVDASGGQEIKQEEEILIMRPESGREMDVERLGDDNDDDDDDDDEPEALDGGWAYVVLLGAFVILMSMGIIANCFSILFLDFLNQLQTPSSVVAAIFNTENFLWCSSNLLGGALVEHFGWRGVAFVGGLLISAGFTFSAFATSAPYLFFSHSLLVGVGSGLCCLVAYCIIPFYFKRLRGRATGIMSAGMCVGGILGPPTITYLQQEYAYRGATLIVAGFMLNNCAAAAVFHPAAWHKRKKDEKTVTPKEVSGDKHLKIDVDSELRDISSTYKPGNDETDDGTTENRGLVETSELIPSKTWIENSEKSTGDLSLTVNKETTRTKSHIPPSASKNKPDLKTTLVALFRTLLRNIGILRYASAHIISVGGCFLFGVYLNFMMMVPFAMKSEGYTQEQASWGVSLCSIFNLLSRIVVTPLTDLPFFNTRVLFIISTAGLMVMVIMFCFVKGIVWKNVSLGMFGFMAGSCLNLYTLLMVESMGVYKYMAIMGVAGVINGIWLVASGPLFGVIRDVSGSYTITMCALASTALITIILYLFLPAALAYDKRKEKEQGREKCWGKVEEKSKDKESRKEDMKV